MRKNLVEITILLATIVLYANMMGDDEDKKKARKNPYIKYTLEQLNRVSGDLLFFYNPDAQLDLIGHSAPLVKTTGDLLNLIPLTCKTVYYEYEEDENKLYYQSGPRKGEYKLASKTASMIPLIKPTTDFWRLWNKQPYQIYTGAK